MPKEFTLPDLGEGITEAQIVRVLIKEGERVAADQYLMEVETDKAAVEIPSPFSGIARRVHVHEGQTINVGDVIVTFDDVDGSAAATGPQTGRPGAAGSGARSGRPTNDNSEAAPVVEAPPLRATTSPAAPAVRKLARELGVDLDQVESTGPGGRVTKEDVERHAKGPAAAPAVMPAEAARRAPGSPPGPRPGIADADKWGPVRREPLSQIRKTIANQMSRSAHSIPHVTHTDEVDITELERVRRELNDATGNNPKLTVLSFVIRATCLALRRYPIFNASFDEEGGQIIYKDYISIGVAVDTDRGLIVPVIRNTDTLGLRGIAAELRTIADRIRTNQFRIEDLRGGTFTITNVGALGGLFSTPIINAPEVAILGLGRSREVPVIRDGQIKPARTLPLNVSFDHRATDGANAARFTRELSSYLEMPAKLLLD